jgi:hypothetical protein
MSDFTDLFAGIVAGDHSAAPTPKAAEEPTWKKILHILFGGFAPIDALPPVSVDKGGTAQKAPSPLGTAHKVPSTIGSDKPNSTAGPASVGDIARGFTDGITGGFNSLGSTLLGIEHSAEVGGVFLLLALLFLLSLAVFLTSGRGK